MDRLLLEILFYTILLDAVLVTLKLSDLLEP